MGNGKTEAVGRASGKVILLGEHAVVHGMPALAAALERGVRAVATRRDGPMAIHIAGRDQAIRAGDGSAEGTAIAALLAALGIERRGFEIRAEIDLPIGGGLGSSAALAGACARALVALFGIDCAPAELFEAVQASERVFHGNPSGLDATLALGGGVVAFTRAGGARPVPARRPPLLVVDSGEPGETKTTVARFATRLRETGDEGQRRLHRIREIVETGIRAIEGGDLRALGSAMDENHEQLRWFSVSTETLDRIAEIARSAGALGAKLTGGGGGGCALVLVAPGDTAVGAKLAEARFRVIAL